MPISRGRGFANGSIRHNSDTPPQLSRSTYQVPCSLTPDHTLVTRERPRKSRSHPFPPSHPTPATSMRPLCLPKESSGGGGLPESCQRSACGDRGEGGRGGMLYGFPGTSLTDSQVGCPAHLQLHKPWTTSHGAPQTMAHHRPRHTSRLQPAAPCNTFLKGRLGRNESDLPCLTAAHPCCTQGMIHDRGRQSHCHLKDL